jgi:hypothetical protein
MRNPFHLQRIQEIRPFITHIPDILLTLAIQPMISLPRFPERVFAPQHDVHEDGAAEETEEHVGEHDGVTGYVARFVLGVIDV